MSSSNEYVATPPRQRFELPGFMDGDPDAFLEGRLLGSASSRRDAHNHVGPLPADWRCSACRWFDVRIFRTSDEPVEYAVYTAGFSVVPGETTRPKLQRTSSAFDVAELMIIRNSKDGTIMPRPNARALAQAAGHDELVQDAYVNRVTV
jgi:hypothetical protein